MISKTNPRILTVSGQYFSYSKPHLYEYNIEEIAHSLSRLCRFTGHVNCPGIYSVAQHSILVSLIVPDELKISALMHDAAEAYVGDVNSPLKQLLPEYKKIEKRIEYAIFNFFNLRLPGPIIKKADLRLLAAEHRYFQPYTNQKWQILEGVEPFPSTGIQPMTPEEAYTDFMYYWEYYNDLPITRQTHRKHNNES